MITNLDSTYIPLNTLIRQARLAAFGVFVALAAALTLGGGEEVLAACTPDIWPNTDTPYITLCDADEDILIDVEDVDITATVSGIRGSGIVGWSEGNPSGDVTVNVRGGSIKTSGRTSPGIRGQSLNGNVTVNVQDVSITTDSTTDTRQDRSSPGIAALINTVVADSPDGKVSILAKDVTILTSGGRSSHGVFGFNSSKRTDNPDADTDVDIDIEDSSITTEGSSAHGIFGEHRGDGDVNIDVLGSHITSGDYHGIYGLRALSGDRADTTGDINIDARDSIITTKGVNSYGIYAKNEGITKTIFDINVDDYVSYVVSNGYASGDIHIDVQGVTITTESMDVDPDTFGTESHGIYGRHLGEGDIHIDVQDSTTITTKGVNSYGIYGYHEDVLGDGTPGSNGDINIDVRDSSITTFGEGSHGILAEHDSGMGSIDILVNRGTIHASGAGASGVKVGSLNDDGEVIKAGGLDEEGYRKQTVTVNGRVIGNAAGVYLAGGGRVVIGPQGSVGAKSGIAILATGTVPEVPEDNTDPNNVIPAIPAIQPKLRVDMNLDGRRVAQAIGHNWIMNDGGETTIAVNNIVLHEGATGIVTDAVAHNGAWNVRMREEGVTVDRSTDPWTISAPATNVFADRDFSVQDFMQVLSSAQVDRAQCGDSTLTTQAPITNVEATSSTTDLSVDVDGVKISATGATESGIHQVHRGEGDITVNVRRSCVETSGAGSSGHQASGILANSDSGTNPATNDGQVKIDVRDSTIMTQGTRTKGIAGTHTHTGGIDIDVENAAITTEGEYAYGIYGLHSGTGGIDIDVQNTAINTMGDFAYGIYGSHRGSGKVDIDVENATITTQGRIASGVYGIHTRTGGIDINVENTTINALGQLGLGIYGKRTVTGSGDLNITANNVDITAFGTGILAILGGAGDTTIDVQDSSINTTNQAGYGIYTDHLSKPVVSDTEIDVENSTITTWGENAHGIYSKYDSGMGSIDILVNRGMIHASGTGASGVKVGDLDNNGEVTRAGSLDEDGTRRQTVTVNGRVVGNEAGVYLAGGGRVVIGPQGSVGAVSGIAILATGDTPPEMAGDPAIQPKLRVDMNLAGRRVAQVIGNDWIMNDGGETTIAVNNTVLHEGDTGVTGVAAPNGAWNITMREEGVTVNRDDPASWVISEPAVNVVVDRDFSAQDFKRARRPQPVPAPDPETDTDTDTEMPVFMEEYAPRAALYESLPGFLLRLRSQGHTGARLVSPESPVWLALSTGSGSVDPSRSTTGADYDLDRIEVQAGRTMDIGKNLAGWVALHHTQGESEVSSPTGGGDIDAKGRGISIGALWSHAGGYYLDGHASWTDYYDIDFSSDDLGRLKSNVDALGTSFGLETGRRMVIGETFQMTPRAWLSHSSIDIDSFTDAVGAKASFPDEVRLTGGIGALAETLRDWKGGELTWHGSLDIEQTLNSRSTRADVSGEQLKSETVSTRMLLGLGSLYQKGDLSISGQVFVDGLGTDDEDYSGQVNIGVRL